MPSSAPSAAIHPALAELSGTVLESRYRLGRILGAGGMGAVFEATQLRLDRKVAIKVIRPVFAGHEEFIKRFLREAKAASMLDHPNVVEIIDYGETPGGLVYSVMKFLQGQDLEAYLDTQPEERLPWAQACGLLAQIAAGLKAAHERGVIHRDIKPANCFLTTTPDDKPLVKVVDFGIAKVEDGDHSQPLTGTAEVLGTPAYIAPELVRTTSPASPRSDIYSLGVLAYRMLTGRVPFTGATQFEVLHHSCFDPVPPIRDHVPDLPRVVESFVLSLLEKDPAKRPQDMLTVRDTLLALGRDTIGPTAVDIPVSAALAIDPSPSGNVAEPAKTPPPRVSGNTGPPYVHTTTEVWLPPAPVERPVDALPPTLVLQQALDERPSDEAKPMTERASAPFPRASAEPVEVKESVADPGSTLGITMGENGLLARPPTHSGSTREDPIPESLGTSSQPSPGHRPKRWLAVGGLLSVLGVGAVVVGLAMGKETDDDQTGAIEARPAGPPNRDTVPTIVPASPDVVAPRRDDETKTEPAPAIEIDSPSTESASPPPVPEPQLSSGTPVTTSTSTPPESLARPKSSSLPTDAAVVKKLKHSIKTGCSALMAGESIEIELYIDTDGRVIEVVAKSKSVAAEKCAEPRIKGARFRPRSTGKALKLTVE